MGQNNFFGSENGSVTVSSDHGNKISVKSQGISCVTTKLLASEGDL